MMLYKMNDFCIVRCMSIDQSLSVVVWFERDIFILLTQPNSSDNRLTNKQNMYSYIPKYIMIFIISVS